MGWADEAAVGAPITSRARVIAVSQELDGRVRRVVLAAGGRHLVVADQPVCVDLMHDLGRRVLVRGTVQKVNGNFLHLRVDGYERPRGQSRQLVRTSR